TSGRSRPRTHARSLRRSSLRRRNRQLQRVQRAKFRRQIGRERGAPQGAPRLSTGQSRPPLSVEQRIAMPVAACLVLLEDFSDLRMAYGLARGVGQQILFGDIGDVFSLRVFRE